MLDRSGAASDRRGRGGRQRIAAGPRRWLGCALLVTACLAGCGTPTDAPAPVRGTGAPGAGVPVDPADQTAGPSGAGLSGGRPSAGGPSAGGPSAGWSRYRIENGVVTHVVDGDTIDVAGVGRIRVIGIDTPERGECGFDSATQAMAALVDAESVVLTAGAQTDVDRYDRLLRYVDVAGVDAGLRLIEQGWAIARYDSRDGYGAHPREASYWAADATSEDLGCYPD